MGYLAQPCATSCPSAIPRGAGPQLLNPLSAQKFGSQTRPLGTTCAALGNYRPVTCWPFWPTRVPVPAFKLMVNLSTPWSPGPNALPYGVGLWVRQIAGTKPLGSIWESCNAASPRNLAKLAMMHPCWLTTYVRISPRTEGLRSAGAACPHCAHCSALCPHSAGTRPGHCPDDCHPRLWASPCLCVYGAPPWSSLPSLLPVWALWPGDTS